MRRKKLSLMRIAWTRVTGMKPDVTKTWNWIKQILKNLATFYLKIVTLVISNIYFETFWSFEVNLASQPNLWLIKKEKVICLILFSFRRNNLKTTLEKNRLNDLYLLKLKKFVTNQTGKKEFRKKVRVDWLDHFLFLHFRCKIFKWVSFLKVEEKLHDSVRYLQVLKYFIKGVEQKLKLHFSLNQLGWI